MTRPCILVIITSDLRRFVPALGAMAAIRAFHADAEIVALTHPDTAAFAATSPYVDDAWPDPTLGSRDLRKWRDLRARLRSRAWARIYDLDASRHSTHVFWLIYGRRGLSSVRGTLPWSGVLPRTAFACRDPHFAQMHLKDQWAAQLRLAGIPITAQPDLAWVARGVRTFAVPFKMNEPFVLLALDPGPGGIWPRWPEFARTAREEGRVVVTVGFRTSPEQARDIAAIPGVVDLVGQATISELVFMTWAATAVVGADNGVMHLAASAGCRTVVLYDGASDPALVGQRGSRVTILRRPHLGQISAAEVLAALRRP